MKKNLFIVSFLVLVIAYGLFIFWPESNSKKTENKVSIGYTIEEGPNHGPLIIALEKGFFKEVGLDVKLVSVSGNKKSQALGLGDLDFSNSVMISLCEAITNGAPIKIIAHSSLTTMRLFVRPDGQFDTFKKLEGGRIAAQPATTGDLILRYAFKNEGVDYSKITFVDVDRTMRTSALMKSRDVDAAINASQNSENMEAAGAVAHKEWEEKGYSKANSPENSLTNSIAVNSNYLTKNPANAKKLIAALIKSHRFIHDNPEQAAEIISSFITRESLGAVTFSASGILKMWREKLVGYLLWRDLGSFENFVKTAYAAGAIKRPVEMNEIFDFSFAPELSQAENSIYGTD